MDIKGAELIAGAIALVGGCWLYLAEVRPAQLREECTFVFTQKGQDRAFVKDMIDFCVGAGGIDKLNSALDAKPPWPSIREATEAE